MYIPTLVLLALGGATSQTGAQPEPADPPQTVLDVSEEVEAAPLPPGGNATATDDRLAPADGSADPEADAPLEGGDARSDRMAPILRIAVYDLERSGVDGRLVRIVTDSLLVELRKLKRVDVVGMDEIRAMLELEADKQILGCEEDTSCLAEIADALGVDALVVGTLASVADASVFGLKRIEQKTATTSGSVNYRLEPNDGEEFLAAVGRAVEELFPDVPLKDGETRGVSEEMALLINPPPLPRWSALAVGGLAAALGAATLLGAAATGGLLAQRQLYAATGHPDADTFQGPIDGRTLATWDVAIQAAAAVAIVACVATLATAGATAAMSPWVDWRDSAEAGE